LNADTVESPAARLPFPKNAAELNIQIDQEKEQ